MKILITGGNGMLAHALKEVFVDHEVVAPGKEDLDITNADQVEVFLKNAKPDLVINAAAYTAVDDSESNEELATSINGTGVGNLAKSCNALDVSLVHYSTDYVFNGEKSEGYNESEQIDPVSAYGRSKAVGEELLQKNHDKFYLLRISWLYGPNGKNFVATMLRVGKERPEVRVVSDQFGVPCYTFDIARATKYIVENKLPFGIYHPVSSGSCSWDVLAREVFTQSNMPVKVVSITTEEYPLPAKRPHYSILLNTKLPAGRAWQEGLREFLEKEGISN